MKKVLSILIIASILLTPSLFSAYAKEAPTGVKAAVLQADSAKKKNGWVVTASGKKRYLKNGKYVRNKIIKIKKYRYYFNKKGYLVTGKTVKYKKKKLYLSRRGRLRAYSRKDKFYFQDGEKMGTADKEDFKCRLKAEAIAEDITDDTMTKKEKLSVCFNWVMNKYYATHRQSCNVSYWPAVYANDHFNGKGGDCHSDAAAFAYLAAAVGYKNVYVCNDSKGVGPNAHAWAEIDGKVYDPLFAQAKSYSKNYGVGYSTYKLYPVLHVNLDYNDKRMKK